ncbi:thioesterase family protein [Pelomyxa schiedti]|nr:thioesterase family protein [Pelomyxa schiedti]
MATSTPSSGSGSGLVVGLKREAPAFVVQTEHTAAKYSSGLAPVLATPHLVAMFECCGKDLMDPFLEPGRSSVGSFITVKHTAPTPVGMKVTISMELVAVDGPRLKFKGIARDEVEVIGECEHERFIINWERFMAKVAAKQAKIATSSS